MSLSPYALALVGLMGMSGCGGRESIEDAPALLGSSIPAAAPSAEGVDLPSALVRGPGGPSTRSRSSPPPMKGDPFGMPAPAPVPVPAPPVGSSPGGVEL